MLGDGDVKIAAVDLARPWPQHEDFEGIGARSTLTVRERLRVRARSGHIAATGFPNGGEATWACLGTDAQYLFHKCSVRSSLSSLGLPSPCPAAGTVFLFPTGACTAIRLCPGLSIAPPSPILHS